MHGDTNMKLMIMFVKKNVRARITAANLFYHALKKIVTSRYVSKHTKLKIHTTVIKPTVLYVCGNDRANEIIP